MPAKGSLPRGLTKRTQKMPIVPGIAQMAKSVEQVLPSNAPKISSAIPCNSQKFRVK